MKKILIIDNCRQCNKFENNMYYGLCCWHDKIAEPHTEGKIPKKIPHKGRNDYYKFYIPSWCPLENYIES